MSKGEWRFDEAVDIAVRADDDGTYRIVLNFDRGHPPIEVHDDDGTVIIDDGLGNQIVERWIDAQGEGTHHVTLAAGLKLPGIEQLMALRDRLTGGS